jgi:prepilin-type N-terminal cleavage/methylation domain-containing protein
MRNKSDISIGIRSKNGFSLIELIIVIAILAIAIPNIGKYVETTRRSVCNLNIVQLEKYYEIYLEKNEKDHSENILSRFGLEYEESYGQICPSNGTSSYKNGTIKCGKHSGKESSDDETEEIPYI